MNLELAAWNEGNGIDLQSWISCSGSFRLAVGYMEYFWPEFELIEGYIVRVRSTCGTIKELEQRRGGDRREFEATINHMHLIDINYHDHENLSEDLLLRLGTILTEIYEAKLRWQFPERPCTVSLHIPEDRQQFSAYEITFWQKAHELKIEEAEIADANFH
jgi:hypothetical protein